MTKLTVRHDQIRGLTQRARRTSVGTHAELSALFVLVTHVIDQFWWYHVITKAEDWACLPVVVERFPGCVSVPEAPPAIDSASVQFGLAIPPYVLPFPMTTVS